MPSAKSPAEILRADRDRALRFAEKAGVARVRRLLERAQADLNRRLKERADLLGDDESFTAVRARATLGQIREVLRALQTGMKGELLANAAETAKVQAEGTLRYLSAAEARYQGVAAPLPLDEARLLAAPVRGAEASALRRIASDPAHPGRPGVLERYGEAVVGRFEEQLQLGLVSRRPWAETRAALVAESPFLQGAPAHWAERIVRTEAMAASCLAAHETIVGAADVFDDMAKILCATFDARTAADSYAAHGQIRRPSEPFDTWQGKVMHPPARPNDREVVVPHRLAWPIPSELKPRSDGEVATRWSMEGRKGSPPRRPKLSTIPAKDLAAANVPRLGAVSDSELDYLRDEGSFREGSFRHARDAMKAARAKGATATEAALSLDPIRLDVESGGARTLADGRHRWKIAREEGAAAVRARVVRYGPRGAIRSDRIEVVKIRHDDA